MNSKILLGSIVRLPMNGHAKEGMLVMRQDQKPELPTRLTIQMDADDGHEGPRISFPSPMYELALISPPPAGSMLVMYGMGSLMERVRHLAPGRLAALDWLEENRPDWREYGDIAIVPANPDEPTWTSPVPLALVPDRESLGFMNMPEGVTGIPVGKTHPGAFGFKRRHHVHEGVDLYVPDGTPVTSVEDGRVIAVLPFTGAIATPPTTFWKDTWAVLVEGRSGTVVYGEVADIVVEAGQQIMAGTPIGRVRQVLDRDKVPPRPKAMLHLELHVTGTDDAYEWPLDGPRPASLLDPTEMLLSICLYG